MAFHLRRQQKFVADPDEMSPQGTKQSHPQGLQHLSGLFTTFERQWLKSSALPMVAGTGAKYSFTGAIFCVTTSAAELYSTIDAGAAYIKGAGATRDTAGTVFKLREHGWFWQDPVSPKVQSTLG